MGTVPSVDPCLTLTGGIFTFRMKLTRLILPLLIGVAWGITADISPYVFRIKRAPQDVQPNTKIFTSNQVNSAAAGALFGSLLSYGQNQVFNPCTRKQNTNTKFFGGNNNLATFAAGTAAGYGASQLATTFLGGCG